ncbi:MAG: hypothetical protein ACE15F_24985 [bacterium]
MSKRYNRDTPWNSCRWLQKLIELYFRLLEWTIRHEFKMEEGLKPFTLIHDDSDALGIHTIEDIPLDSYSHYESMKCWDGQRYFTLDDDSLQPHSAAGGSSLEPASHEDSVKRIRFKLGYCHLTWREVIGLLDRIYSHAEPYMIQAGRTWDGPPRFRDIDSGQKILEYIEAKQVDPKSLLIDLNEAKSKYRNDLGFVRRNLDKNAAELHGNLQGKWKQLYTRSLM